jgi:hypothetical protein
MQAVDSFSPHTDRSCQALADRGIVGALRYQYNTSRAEVDRLHRHGLSFGLIFERNGNAAVVNPEAGNDHGNAAVAFARSIGLPEGCAIYFAEADTMVQRHQYDRARRYWSLAGAPTRAAGYRVGAYGGSVLIDTLHAEGIVDLTWETGAMSWNEWVHSQTCALRQLLGYHDFGGVQTDLNDVVVDDWGQWTPTGAYRPPADDAGTTQPPESEEDDDMLKAPRPSWVAPKGRYGLNPQGRLVHVSGPAVADELDRPNQGHPPELLAAIEVTDETLDGLLAFYNT